MRQKPTPYSNKQNAVIYINSNCGTNSGRHAVLTQLGQLLQASKNNISIHSYGRCQAHPMHAEEASIAEFHRQQQALPKERGGLKLKYMAKYRFCVVCMGWATYKVTVEMREAGNGLVRLWQME